MSYINIQENDKEFKKCFLNFQNEMMPRGEKVFFMNEHYKRYMAGTMNEFITQLITLKKTDNLKLRVFPSWVRNFESKGEKFIRLTIQPYCFDDDNEVFPLCSMSNIEMSFGTYIHGFTYVMSKTEYQHCKKVIHNIIPFEAKEEKFGKKTRYTMSGEAYRRNG